MEEESKVFNLVEKVAKKKKLWFYSTAEAQENVENREMKKFLTHFTYYLIELFC